MRSSLAVVCLTVLLVACGGGDLSLAEYAERVDALGLGLGEQLAAGDARMSSGTPTLTDAQEVLTGALAARTAFQEGMTALDPPDLLADLHTDLVEVHSRIIAAHKAFVARTASAATLEDLDQSAEATAYRAIGTEAASLCEEFRARIDTAADGAALADTPWIPGDMKEVVAVTFGC